MGFIAKIANLKFDITPIYNETYRLCKNFIIDEKECDIAIKSNQQIIDEERNISIEDNAKYSDNYLETVAIYRQIGNIIPDYNGLIFHGAAIEYKNKCFMFVAPSGTGKTTHIDLWKKHIPNLNIINGDKPIIRLIDDVPIVFGTPWNGKEHYGSNSSCELNSIIIVKRGDIDKIYKVDGSNYLNDLLSKIYIPKDKISIAFDLINKMIQNVNVYVLECTMNDSAFITSFEELTGEKYED